MKKFEYRTELVAWTSFMDPSTKDNPNELGKKGWEILHITMLPNSSFGNCVWIFYKREID